MPIVIQTNVSSLVAQKNYSATQGTLAKSFERLSSGFRINSASDGSADLAMSETLKAQIRSYSAAERNAGNAISMLETAETGLSNMSDLLSQMREIAVQSSNGDLTTTDRSYLQIEFVQLQSEIERVSAAVVFNTNSLLTSNATSVAFQVGIFNSAATTERITVTFAQTNLNTLSISAGNASVGGASTNATAAITSIDAALVTVNSRRASLGGSVNRFQIVISHIQSMAVNLGAANSRIRDVDVADETATLARSQVIAQAASSVLAQANAMPRLALSLLG